MVNFTLDELLEFTQNEEEMVNDVLPVEAEQKPEPSELSVINLLAYSKALSIRKSSKLTTFRFVLN